MPDFSVPVRKRVRDNLRTVIHREINGQALVDEGEEVTVDTIIGDNRRQRETRLVFPKVAFSVAPGDKVEIGQKIGSRKGFMGLSTSNIVSPLSGEVLSVDKSGAIVIAEDLGTEKVAAGCWGRVRKVGSNDVEIETVVMEINGVTGLGRSGEGFVHTLVDGGGIIMPQTLDKKVTDSIICGGSLIVRETVEKAQALGAKGIIVGGINYLDYLQLHRSSFYLPIIVIDGFGAVPMSLSIPESYAIIDGRERKITIPKNIKLDKATTGEQEMREVPLRVGMSVRILSIDKLGQSGKVEGMSSGPGTLPSGLKDYIAKVSVDTKIVEVPVSNLEAIL